MLNNICRQAGLVVIFLHTYILHDIKKVDISVLSFITKPTPTVKPDWLITCIKQLLPEHYQGARCISMVRAFTHGAMGHRIDPSWWTHRAISRSSHCSTTGVTKAVVCVILSVGYKRTLLLIEKSSPCDGSGFPPSLPEWSFTISSYQHHLYQSEL